MKSSKKLLSLLLVLCMVLSLTCTAFAAEEPATAAYTLADVSEGLTAGEYLIRGIPTSSYDVSIDGNPNAFMKASVDSKDRPESANLAVADGKVTTDAADVVWTVAAVDGGVTIYNEAVGYLYYAGSGNTVAFTTDAAKASVWNVAPVDGKVGLQSGKRMLAANRFGSEGSFYYGFATYATDSSVKSNLEFYKLDAVTPPVEKSDDIVVLYTNDVHCQVDPAASNGVQSNFGYANIAAYKSEMLKQYSNVALVDCGDAIQGGPIGAMTKGEAIVTAMNAAGYDIATFGNHEFDYGLEQLAKLTEMSDAEYISSTLVYTGEDGKAALDDSNYQPYVIKEYGETKVAFVGISTPESFTKSTPTFFQDENGKYVYSFNEGNNGADLYKAVQGAVDEAKNAGAQYVVAVAHTGIDEASKPWTSYEVIANTTGIDAYLDGHSHSTIAGENVKNKDGADVLLSSTGTKLANIGKLVIDADGGMTTELVAAKDYTTVDESAAAVIADVEDELNVVLKKVVAKTAVDLTTLDPETGMRAVRSAETNLGDLCADAYRTLYGADIGFVNGGGVRADIKAGDITFEQIINVHPFSNEACVVKVSGQAVLDALEMSARAYPGENGGFLQVSGLTYTINKDIPTSVVLDDKGAFVKVDGERRVSDVYLYNAETGAYDTAIDPNAVYTVASHNFMLLSGGDGYAMFKNDPKFQQDTTIEPRLDNEVLIDYIVGVLGGTVGEAYSDPYGQGRILVDSARDAEISNILSVLAEPTCYTEASREGVSKALEAYDAAETDEARDAAIASLKEAVQQLVFVDNTFADVKSGWYKKAVDFVQATGAMNGMENNRFRPGYATNRAMVATVLYRMAGEPSVEGMTCPLTDISGNNSGWYHDAVVWAYNEGVITGYPGGTFRPNQAITRQEMAAMLFRMGGGEDMEDAPSADEAAVYLKDVYKDSTSVQSYAKVAVAICHAAGFMVGDTTGNFHPAASLTRAEFAQILLNIYDAGVAQVTAESGENAAAPFALALAA